MRLALPILLMTVTAALAQSQSALSDKPLIYDGPGLRDFAQPQPVTVGPTGQFVPLQPMTAAPAPKSEAPGTMDDRRTDLCSFDNPPPCKKPEPLKQSVKNVG